MASTAVNHVVPGGAATTAAVNFRLFGRAGVEPEALSFALATLAIGSAAVLNVILWAALVVSIPVNGFRPLYASAAIIGALLMAGGAVAVVGLVRGGGRLAHPLEALARRIPRVNMTILRTTLGHAAERIGELRADRPMLVRLIGLATLNWLADAAALWVAIAAFGHRPPVVGLLVAYGLANVMAVVPVTPGGLGVMEAVLIPALIGFGVPTSAASVGVVTYRLFNFWLPIPVGFSTFALVERHFRAGRPFAAVKPMLEELSEGAS
jgi:uncharacterized membrane protein YbhN (UPF0104 family)